MSPPFLRIEMARSRQKARRGGPVVQVIRISCCSDMAEAAVALAPRLHKTGSGFRRFVPSR